MRQKHKDKEAMQLSSFQKIKEKNGYRKTSDINNLPKCKWAELFNKKAPSVRLDQKGKPDCMLPSRGTSQLQE